MDSPKRSNDQKEMLHSRNRHRARYDFPALIRSNADLSNYVLKNQYDDLSIDFKDPEAVKSLNRSLLVHFYGIHYWDIPKGYLCPPIPGRADYIHNLADLLAADNGNRVPEGRNVRILDVGVGANCIYPLIGHKEYGWSFIGSDIDSLALRNARSIVEANMLSKAIAIRRQSVSAKIFTGIINTSESFDATICNPPFHASRQAAMEGTERKWKNLKHKKQGGDMLNFGGQGPELWCEGGEEGFLTQMIRESSHYAGSCKWFTSLISKKETLAGCYRELTAAGAVAVKTIEMSQGQKKSRILAWTFRSDTPQLPVK